MFHPILTILPAILYHSSFLLVIYFDGSIRIPKDPNADSILIPPKNNIQNSRGEEGSGVLRRTASCAAAFFDETDDNDVQSHHYPNPSNYDLVWMNGKSISLTPDLTSADVEYEGLILALNGLLELLQRDNDEDKKESILSSFWGDNKPEIIIRGDCKTIADQMNEISKPRKQRPYFEKAKSIIGQIQSIIRSKTNGHNDDAAAASGDDNSSTVLDIKFEHIVRDENKVCDFMCQKILRLLQIKMFQYVLDSIEMAKHEIQQQTSGDPNKRLLLKKLPSSKAKRLKFTKTEFNRPLTLLSDTMGIVPFSMRPYGLLHLAKAAKQVDDPVALRGVGRVLKSESLRIIHNTQQIPLRDNDPSSSPAPASNLDTIHQLTLHELGFLLELDGLRGMGLEKEADKIADKKIQNIYETYNVIDLCGKVETANQKLFVSPIQCIDKISRDETTTLNSGWDSIIAEWNQFVYQQQIIENESMTHILELSKNNCLPNISSLPYFPMRHEVDKVS